MTFGLSTQRPRHGGREELTFSTMSAVIGCWTSRDIIAERAVFIVETSSWRLSRSRPFDRFCRIRQPLLLQKQDRRY
jgi:hypothetical protein